MRALVLSGGGLFGAWQAGAWIELAGRFEPDLIVGASAGCLNGYAIACGATPDRLRDLWLSEENGSLSKLHVNIRALAKYSPKVDFAVVITDLLRLKPRIIRGRDVTWRHLAASCAVPMFLPQMRIDGRLYTDGGLLNPLPVWAAVDLGATEILALHALPDIPSAIMQPFVMAFRATFGINPPVPKGVSVKMILPGQRLGSVRDALKWDRNNIERWLAQGEYDARKAG